MRLALPDDLDVRKITGVGFRAAEALASLGVRAVGELRDLRSGDGVLDDAAVARFRGLARGVDDDPVKHTGRARAVGVEQSFWQHRLDTGDARATAAALDRAAKESEIPNFKGSDLGHFPLVSADFGRAIISRNGLEAWMLFPERARAEHSR